MNKHVVFIIFFILIGCTTTTIQPSPTLSAGKRWVLLPLQNFSQTPQAGERAEAILATLLRAKGIQHLDLYSSSLESNGLPELDEKRRYEQFLNRAREQNYTYAVTGSVEEWQYKSGVEGAPAIGVSLQLIDITTGNVLWSASGSRAGWGRETLSGTAQDLLKKMIAALRIN